jgi:hypothetical protein
MHNVYYVIFDTGNPLTLCLNNVTDAIAESEWCFARHFRIWIMSALFIYVSALLPFVQFSHRLFSFERSKSGPLISMLFSYWIGHSVKLKCLLQLTAWFRVCRRSVWMMRIPSFPWLFYVSISLHYLKCHLNYEVLSIGNGKNSREACCRGNPVLHVSMQLDRRFS